MFPSTMMELPVRASSISMTPILVVKLITPNPLVKPLLAKLQVYLTITLTNKLIFFGALTLHSFSRPSPGIIPTQQWRRPPLNQLVQLTHHLRVQVEFCLNMHAMTSRLMGVRSRWYCQETIVLLSALSRYLTQSLA